jgi:hypothetical protein
MKNERLKKAGFVLWVFIHLLLLMVGILFRDGEFFEYAVRCFYPWEAKSVINYDITEFVVYVITPIFLYYLYRYVIGDKISFIK